jgi:hypothetical protein
MGYTNALAITVALSLLVVALQAWGLRRKVIKGTVSRSGPDRDKSWKGMDRRREGIDS